MANIIIAVINQSTVLADGEVLAATAAFQIQVSRDFAPVWGIDAQLIFVPQGTQPPAGAWWLVVLDNSDQAGALGYHDLTPDSLPLGKVFAGTDRQYGSQWTVTASHELLEMLGDPDINLCASVANADGSLRLYAYEVADACEADHYGYSINNLLVSDFVYPAWFESFRQPNSAQFDYAKAITAPFQLLSGGYIGVYDTSSSAGWTQLTAAASTASYEMRARVGSRRERRRIPRAHWLNSRPVSKAASRDKSPLQTLRNPVFSLMQSALHQTLKRRVPGTVRMSAGHPAMQAFHRAAKNKIETHAHPASASLALAAAPGLPATAAGSATAMPTASLSTVLSGGELYAEMGWAEITGNTARRDALANELKYGPYDVLWAECVTTYLAWSETGTPIPYLPYAKLSDFVIGLPNPQAANGQLVIGIIGDWGTGMEEAGWLLGRLLTQKVDVLIHLGDIYYSGTVPETADNFMKLITAAGLINNAGKTTIPIYTLAGNHDMYSGGAGYYNLLTQLGQPASFFCLRNDYWQILGLDTGYNDADPHTVNTNLTTLYKDPSSGVSEAQWHLDKINTMGGRKTILLSHHQLFSPYDDGVGQDPASKNYLVTNPNLFQDFSAVLDKITLWIWGHEHSCNIFNAYNGLSRGRCVGASAVPAMASDGYNPPLPPLSETCGSGQPPLNLKPQNESDPNSPPLKLKLNADGEYYHCYAILRLNSQGPDGTAEYYQIDSANNGVESLFYTETF